MKALFWISLIIAILLPLAWFGFILFAFGGCVILMVTCFGSGICMFTFLFLVLAVIIMLLVNLIGIIRLRKRHRAFSLIPMILIIIGPLAAILMTRPADYLCETRFQRYLARYERAASEIESSITPEGDYNTPSGTAFLSYVPPNMYREEDGSLTIEFFVEVWPFPPRHVAYLYCSNGVVAEGSRTAKRWHHRTQVNEHWFRVSDRRCLNSRV